MTNKTEMVDTRSVMEEIEELNREIRVLERENFFIDRYLERWG